MQTKACRLAAKPKIAKWPTPVVDSREECTDAGNRNTNSRKCIEHQNVDVGAWRRIGGGQGALSQA